MSPRESIIQTLTGLNRRLTPRERFLLVLIAVTLFLLVNASLFSRLHRQFVQTEAASAAQRAQIHSMRQLLAEGPLWVERENWLLGNQPRLDPASQAQAPVALLEEVKEIAKSCEIILENPELGSVEKRPACQAVPVQCVVKSSWPGLIQFLHALQTPQRFIAIENAELQTDPSNPSRMAARLKIAKWYAP